MDDAEPSIEWDEPAASPENSDFVMTYSEFMHRAWSIALWKTLKLITILVALVLLVLIVTHDRAPLKKAGLLLLFFLAVFVLIVVMLQLLYRSCLRVQRRVRVSRDAIEYSVLLQRKRYPFGELSRIIIEAAGNGDHRLILFGNDGELCRLRVPSAVALDSMLTLIPAEKLARAS